ncbi:MAG: class I SAM-dependent rRNA methyltransferase [Eubacteriales bacterium]|nr:class I SAM-dependent rRNA methyltransferase [Eubacteriales bacterium]MDY4898884.1 class I SAM-dependent rRNA methyltransferase [Eubacteriales bacterium]
MKSQRNYPIVTVTAKGEAAARGGHPWVYGEEIINTVGEPENGGMVDVVSARGAYLGTGLFSAASKIRVRILSRNGNDRFDDAFWKRRLRYAVDYRRTVMRRDFNACRLVFGESDGLPGLTVDRYSEILVAQFLSYGLDARREMLMRALVDILEKDGDVIRGVYERSDVALRAKEGLEMRTGWIDIGRPLPDSTLVDIRENGILYTVDVEHGQKTGFFLDQKYNRRAVAQLTAGMRVLDCFTHTGSFALNAAAGGAEHVTAVDISEAAVELARQNARRNGLEDRMDFVCTDVFELLTSLSEAHQHPYDMIILDPPAFTKSRKTVDSAQRGYYEINRRAMRLLPRGGYLATASCSHFMDNALFEKMLRRAAADAQAELRQVEVRQQSPDHPTLWNVPETAYLKFYIFQIV